MAFMLKTFRTLSSVGRNFHTSHTIKKDLPDPWDLATGLERWIAVQFSKGNVDPFSMLPMKRGKGTKDCPIVIQSVYNKRIVGCLCNEDCNHLVFWWLHEGFPRRCDCNYWFVLERLEMPRIYEDSV